MKKVKVLLCLLAMMLFVSACSNDEIEEPVVENVQDDVVEEVQDNEEDVVEKVVELVEYEIVMTPDNMKQYALIKGLDADRNEVWSYQSEQFDMAQVDLVEEIGVFKDLHYHIENGVVFAMDVETGDIVWKSENTGGAGIGFTFDDEGTLYLCGYFGPDFFAVDKDGNTLCLIPTFDPDYWWAYEVVLNGDEAIVSMEGSPTEEVAYVHVNLNDYSYTIE